MKSVNFAVLSLLLVFVACSDAIGPPRSDDALRAKLISMGFRAKDIVDADTVFVVEGDMIFRKADLRDALALKDSRSLGGSRKLAPPNRTMKQWIQGGGYATTGFTVNLYQISDRPAWVQAFRLAMSAWNDIPESGITIVEGNGPDALVAYPSPRGGCFNNVIYIACAQFPVNNHFGTAVTLTEALDDYNESQQVEIIVHELGHALGLRHSDWQANNEGQYGAYLVYGTQSTDNQSVMNHAIGGIPWSGFSNGDRRAAWYISRAPDFTGSYSATGPTVSWPAQDGAVYYVVGYWSSWYDVDEYGFPQEHIYLVDLGIIYGTSVTLPDPDTGESACSNYVYIGAIYPSGGWTSASVPTPTCNY